jgi:hypothetical protein
MPHVTLSEATTALARLGVISQPVASLLSRVDGTVEVPDLEKAKSDPVLACLVIDASPSMEPYRSAVITTVRFSL